MALVVNSIKISAALLYAICSILIIVANKVILTTYEFPSVQVLALGQLFTTLVCIQVMKSMGTIKMADFSFRQFKKTMPLPLFYFGNLLFGLSGTQRLSLPMFSVLRRFSILMTFYGEIFILKYKKPILIQVSIYLMVIGSIIAAYDDLAYDTYGYVSIFLNNLFTAANTICTRMKLDIKDEAELSLIYYNCLFSLLPMTTLCVFTNEFYKLRDFQWFDSGFMSFFVLSALMGVMLNYSTMICTKYNSPLTTTVVGCLKNIFITYVGIFIGGDYIFSNMNFIGITISAFSSVLYSFIDFCGHDKDKNTNSSGKSNSNTTNVNGHTKYTNIV